MTGFFDRLVARGVMSGDRGYYTQLTGALLALCHEPLSSAEIASILSSTLSERERSDLAARYRLDPDKHHLENVDSILRDMGGLIRVAFRADGTRQYRLLHDDLKAFIQTSPAFATVCTKVRSWLAELARKPAGPAAAYFYRNGIAHILDDAGGPEEAGRLALPLLSDFDYQLERLSVLDDRGEDARILDDWVLLREHVALNAPEHYAWSHFWSTDGVLLQRGPHRNLAREFFELALEYAPGTVVGDTAWRRLARDAGEEEPSRGVE